MSPRNSSCTSLFFHLRILKISRTSFIRRRTLRIASALSLRDFSLGEAPPEKNSCRRFRTSFTKSFLSQEEAMMTKLPPCKRLQFSTATTSPQHEDLAHWRLKAIVEAYAINLGCHRSVNELRRMIQSRSPNITSSKCYKQYIFWLWLYTISQHISLVTGAPPSIIEDATIRVAPELLTGLHNSDSVARLLGEVELCLLWSKVAVQALKRFYC